MEVGQVEASTRGTARAEVPVGIIVLMGLLMGATLAWAWRSGAEWPWTRSSSSLATDDGVVSDADWTHAGWATPLAWERSVVRITTTRCGDEIRGSGVIVGGRVITNRHVIDGARALTITTSDGATHRARRLDVSETIDLATIDAGTLDGGLDLSSMPVTGGALSIGGFPGGHDFAERPVHRAGTLHGTGFPDPAAAAHLDEIVVPGESGSAIVDADGNVAAVLYARSTADGKGLAIDGAQVGDELEQLTPRGFATC